MSGESPARLSDFTEPQLQMLRAAAANSRGETYIGRGQTKTAKALAARKLGFIRSPDAYSAVFCIYDASRQLIADD